MEDYLGYILNIAPTARHTDAAAGLRHPRSEMPGRARASRICPATAAWGRYGSATSLFQVQNDVYGASSWPPPTPSSTAAGPPGRPRCSSGSSDSASGRSCVTISPMPAPGSCAPGTRPHILERDVLGGLRPAGAHRPAARPGRAAAYWRGHAQEIHGVICERAWNPEPGSFVSTFGGEPSSTRACC